MGSLSSREQKEISRVRGGRSKYRPILYLALLIGGALFILYVVIANFLYKEDSQGIAQRIRLAQLEVLENDRIFYAEWLADKLGEGASSSFDSVTDVLVNTAALIPLTDNWVSRGWIGLHKGLVRALFLIIAWWKFWLLAMFVAVIWSMRSWQVYFGNDILGRQTNGRLFYSGIRGDLKKSTSSGAPDVQAPGLACPKYSTVAEVKVTALGKVLERYGVGSPTTYKLAGIIVAYKRWPAFVARRNESMLLEASYQNTDLLTHASLVLEAALSLRETFEKYSDRIEALTSTATPTEYSQPLSAVDYVESLKLAFNRVLTPSWKLALTELSAKELATIVLAYEAGKVMAYSDEGSRFYPSSNFPQLCARSILHSIPEYSQEFNYEERATVRRAIIYGSRQSVYGPVKFTVDLSTKTRAARQWVELLMAGPHELEQVSEEVELYGLICEVHELWTNSFIDQLMVSDATSLNGMFAHGTVLYIPFPKLMEMINRKVDVRVQNRLAHLVAAVSHRQQLSIAEGMATGQVKVPDYQKIFSPLTTDEISRISKDHHLEPKMVSDWSALRVVLNYFSWLGRRVGDSTVPESSIIHLAVKESADSLGGDEIISKCYSGMVALRATRLIDRWGAHWNHKFSTVFSVTAVDNMTEFEKFKRGESLDDIDLSTAETM